MLLFMFIIDLTTILCGDELVNTTGWRVQHFLNGEGYAIDSYRIESLDTLAKKFVISFDIEPYQSSEDILLLRNEHGKEILGVRYVNKLVVNFPVNHSDTWEFGTHLNDGWNTVNLVQEKTGHFYTFSIIVSGQVRYRTINTGVKKYEKVEIFVHDYKRSRYSGGPFLRYLNLYAKGCSIRNGDCLDICNFEEQSETISCSCMSGELQADQKSCNFAEHVFFSSGRKILRINSDGAMMSFGKTITGHVSCLAHAYNARMVLFVEVVRRTGNRCASLLWKQNLKTNIPEKVSDLSYCVERIAYDSWRDHLFFATQTGYIGRINSILYSTSPNFYDVIQLEKTRGLVLDECKGLLFVADLKNHVVVSFTTSGEHRKVIAGGLYHVTSLALNRHKFKLYWGDSYSNVIEESNYDGSCRRTIAFISTTNMFSMTYYSGHLYWIDRRTVYETILWRTDISNGLSQIETARQQQMFDVQTYTEESKVSCEVTCAVTSSNFIDSMTATRLDFYLYPYNTKESIELPKGHNVSHLVLLDRNISLFGRQAKEFYVSPKGFISLEPVTYPITFNSLGTNLLAVYASDTTNQFIGNVYVDVTSNTSIYASNFKETFKGSDVGAEHVIVVTWLQIANIRNGEERNTFQVVLATNANETYILLRYPSLGVPFGLVGYINNQCSSASRSVDSIGASLLVKKEMHLGSTQLCNNYVLDKSGKSSFPALLRKILTVTLPVAVIGGIIRLTSFCKSYLRERRRRFAQPTPQVPGPSVVNHGYARNNHAQKAEITFSRVDESNVAVKDIEPTPSPRVKSDTLSVSCSLEQPSPADEGGGGGGLKNNTVVISPRDIDIHHWSSSRIEIVDEIQIHRPASDCVDTKVSSI